MKFLKHFKVLFIIAICFLSIFFSHANPAKAGNMRAVCECTRVSDRTIRRDIEANTYEGLDGACLSICRGEDLSDNHVMDPECIDPEEVLPTVRNESCAAAPAPTAPSPEGEEKNKKQAPLESTAKLKKISFSDPSALVGTILRSVLGLTGSIALLMFVYGGFLWLISGGSPDKIKKAQGILVWATLGLTLIFASYAIVDKILLTFVS